MKIIIIFLILFLCLFNCKETLKNNNVSVIIKKLSLYNKWKQSNERVFLNADEKIFRQLIFFENLDKIIEFNQDPQNTFKMSLNQFSDMTREEFTAKVLITTNAIQDQQQTRVRNLSNISADVQPQIDNTIIPLLKSVDWRIKDAISAVKSQGVCSSSWAFSAAGLIESFNFIKTNTMKDFSKQQLVDCVNPEVGYNSNGCNYGYPQDAIAYSTKFGILESSQYPYIGLQKKCRIQSPTRGYYPKYYRKIPETVDDLKKALYLSPVSVLIDARNWQFYTSGIFNICAPSPVLNQAVLLVGYDIFGNWIIKNSWGTLWGEAGYMRLKSGNTCGITKNSYQITG